MATVYAQMGAAISPPWLDDEGTKYLYSLSVQLDTLAEYLRVGVLQRFPGQCQPSALPHIGADRQLRRGINETDASYISRLQNAFQTWKLAGSPVAVIDQISIYNALASSPVVRYVTNGLDENGTRIADWWTLVPGGQPIYQRANPSNWDWDGTYPLGRFWVIVYLPTLTPWQVGDGHTVGGGMSVGFIEPNQFIADIRALIDQWKAAGSHAGTFDNGCDAGIILAGTSTLSMLKVNAFHVGDGSTVGQEFVVGLFDPSLPPGSPMPAGNWNDPTNRADAAYYVSGI